MLRIPDSFDAVVLREAKRALKARKGIDAAAVRRRNVSEPRGLQVLHVGPYDAIGETYAALDAHAASQGLAPRGGSRELYLSDPGRTAPAKLKTIVRLAVKQRR